VYKGVFYQNSQPSFAPIRNVWFLEYIIRQQTWLRKAVYDFSKTINLTMPCSVIHVRRGDIVLHSNVSRRYIPLEEYVNKASQEITPNVFLLTDDDNAIREARSKFPHLNWIVIDRPRFKGKEGGWENHIPSNDPKMEVIVLLTIFRMVQKCNVLIHSRSNLSDYIAAIMRTARGRKFRRVNLDYKASYNEMYNTKHAETYNLSRSDWRK